MNGNCRVLTMKAMSCKMVGLAANTASGKGAAQWFTNMTAVGTGTHMCDGSAIPSSNAATE
jgi:hypothetical protein